MMWWILLGMHAQAAPDLPKLEAFDASLTRLEGLLDASETSGDSLAEVQATFTNQQCVRGQCPQDLVVALQDAARTFGQQYRLDVQATRAQAGRVERLSDVPTISPLLDAERRRRLRVVRERVDADTERFLKRSAWNRRFVIGQRWVRPGVVEETEEALDPLLLPLPQGMAGANIAGIRSTVLPESQRPGPDLTGVAEGVMLSSELASALGEWGLLWVEAVEELPDMPEEEVEPVREPDDPTYDPGFGEPGYVPRSQRKPAAVDPGAAGTTAPDPGRDPGEQVDPWRKVPTDPSTAPEQPFERPTLTPGSAVPSRPEPVVPQEDLRPDPVPTQPATGVPGGTTPPVRTPDPAPRPEPAAEPPREPPADLEDKPRDSRRERRRQRREASGEGGE